MARHLAASRGVKWVGARPARHKIDVELLDMVRADRGEPEVAYDEEDPRMGMLDAVVADLLPASMQNAREREQATSQALAYECSKFFEGRATAWPVGEGRVLVSVLDVWGSTVGEVIEWLANRWEVRRAHPPLAIPALLCWAHSTFRLRILTRRGGVFARMTRS